MTKHHVPRRAVALFLLIALPACYSYVPLESGSPRAGDDVRVHLTEDATGGSSVASRADAEGRRFVTGLVLRTMSDSLTLAIDGTDARGVGSSFRRDTLRLASSEIRRIERNKVDALRTTVLAGLGAGAIATAVILVINASPSGSGGIGGGGGPRASVAIPISIPAP